MNMLFSVGVEKQKDIYNIIIPALPSEDLYCISSSYHEADIAVLTREKILLTLERMAKNYQFSLEDLKDLGFMTYAVDAKYQHCDVWFVIDVELSSFEGRQQRVSIAMPDILITRIDHVVRSKGGIYRDRSHFLAKAARYELSKYSENEKS